MDGDAQQARQTRATPSQLKVENRIASDLVDVAAFPLKRVAQLMDTSTRVLVNLIRRGELKAYRKCGVRWMVPMWAIREYQQREIDKAAGGGGLVAGMRAAVDRARNARRVAHGFDAGAAVQA